MSINEFRYWRQKTVIGASLTAVVPTGQYDSERLIAVEIHLSYDVKPRLWFSADANFWYGGATSLNGLTTRKSPLRGSTPGFAKPK
jgi:hypothetical protein